MQVSRSGFPKPLIIFSHADARALKEHDRNITDDQIDARAENGGVIGVKWISPFLADNDASTQNSALNDYQGFRRLMHRVTVDGDRSY